MPITPATLTPALVVGLRSGLQLGTAVPKLAQGIANGISQWVPSITVQTTDVGTLGVGTSVGPFTIPQPLMLTHLLIGYGGAQLFGPMAPLHAFGLANGLSTGMGTGIITVQHPGIGTGACQARFSAPNAFPFIMQGLQSVGSNGEGAQKIAKAIGIAFTSLFAVFGVPLAIAGAPTPSAGGGVGFGKII